MPAVPAAAAAAATTLAASLAVQPALVRRSGFTRHASQVLRPSTAKGSRGVAIGRTHTVSVKAILMKNDPRPDPSLNLMDSSSGIKFAKVRELGGESQRCIGIGQVKKSFTTGFLGTLFSSNEYAVAMYVNGPVAAKELSLRERGGLELSGEGDLCDALLDGAFTKSLHLVFTREMLGDEFVELVYSALAPRMRLTESMDDLNAFTAMFKGREFTKGNDVELVWKVNGELQVAIHERLDQSTKKSFESQSLCRGLFEAFLGESTLSPTTKASVAKGAAMLLDSDKTKRTWLKRSILTEQASYDEGATPSWHHHSIDEQD